MKECSVMSKIPLAPILKKESHPVLCEFDEEFKDKKLYL